MPSGKIYNNQLKKWVKLGTIPIDDTLKNHGQAADAKITGDRLGDLSTLNTNSKTNLTSSINEINQNKIDKTWVNDSIISENSGWSSAKIFEALNNKLYGVRFDGDANTGATVHRTYDATGKTAQVGTDTEGCVNDFDNIYPWSGMRRCCGGAVGNKFVVNAYKGEPTYAQDGSNGEVWVEIPLFWYKWDYVGNSEEITISPIKRPGYLPSPIAVMQGTPDNPAEYSYIPAYKLAIIDGKATSRAGVFSDFTSLNNFMAQTKADNENYCTTTVEEQITLYLLTTVEFATRNIQSIMYGFSSGAWDNNCKAVIEEQNTNKIVIESSRIGKFAIGNGIIIGTGAGNATIANNRMITNISDHAEGQSAITFDGPPVNIAIGNVATTVPAKNGICDTVLTSSGSPVSNTDGHHECMYRGIENPYASTYSWCSNVLFNRIGENTEVSPYEYEIMYLPDTKKYNNGQITADYVKLNYKIPPKDGYVKKYGIDDRYPQIRLPIEVGAGSTTRNCDYYYYPRVPIGAASLGGNWFRGASCGLSSWYCNHAPSNSCVYFRARLSFNP